LALIYSWRHKLFEASAAPEAKVPDALSAPETAIAVIDGDAVEGRSAEQPAIIPSGVRVRGSCWATRIRGRA